MGYCTVMLIDLMAGWILYSVGTVQPDTTTTASLSLFVLLLLILHLYNTDNYWNRGIHLCKHSEWYRSHKVYKSLCATSAIYKPGHSVKTFQHTVIGPIWLLEEYTSTLSSQISGHTIMPNLKETRQQGWEWLCFSQNNVNSAYLICRKYSLMGPCAIPIREKQQMFFKPPTLTPSYCLVYGTFKYGGACDSAGPVKSISWESSALSKLQPRGLKA